ncbi:MULTISPECIES: amino acid ABC transporter permease [Rhizobium]|uniref:Amino acid ABC transporter permease n=1 Tax=Rhizobium tropici TaxID=398 RepID=A0A6P1C994_RHITR|nr:MULTISPECIES: amino acid ABC transporter permease [Rhizobium]AGB71069.1 general L-amino acid transport system permease protein AapQ [Rhizobium tropici CIAT 899]MBB4242341.1 general L-amino acid transport system permease protein [Rhizobium tropici]MBB5593984.1 general L-amino acid transport system permease protein [Rhizobium tropici]MBB6492895.1 general L-amino acid transport system permease protein [Rhizobium tropici]NEV13317.1 amino acid ABC transporter permease [Rhizobium tropici]
MAITANSPEGERSALSAALYDPKVRGVFYQAVTIIILAAFCWFIVTNTMDNLRALNRSFGFDFLEGRAGFNLGQALIPYSSDSTNTTALIVGLLNTLLISLVGIIAATIIGFLVGMGRLSHNWLVAKLSQAYVEIFRNIPPLLVIFFWYSGVLVLLPQAREAVHLPFSSYLSNRGLAFPSPIFGAAMWAVGVALLIAIAAVFFVARWAHRRQTATGQQFHTIWVSIGILIGLPLLVFLVTGMPLSFDYPVAGKFNLTGGTVIGPEFLALLLALSLYTASYIAEIVRAGIRGVAKGQSEAAGALGLRASAINRLIVLPQAMRIIIPPLTSQYLNLIKNSSLAIAIGYADIVAVGGVILNQSGRAVEIVILWMVVYLILSIATSLFMNWFNAKMALVER